MQFIVFIEEIIKIKSDLTKNRQFIIGKDYSDEDESDNAYLFIKKL